MTDMTERRGINDMAIELEAVMRRHEPFLRAENPGVHGPALLYAMTLAGCGAAARIFEGTDDVEDSDRILVLNEVLHKAAYDCVKVISEHARGKEQ